MKASQQDPHPQEQWEQKQKKNPVPKNTVDFVLSEKGKLIKRYRKENGGCSEREWSLPTLAVIPRQIRPFGPHFFTPSSTLLLLLLLLLLLGLKGKRTTDKSHTFKNKIFLYRPKKGWALVVCVFPAIAGFILSLNFK